MSTGSRHRFRIKMRPGPGGKNIPWIQQQLFGFLWWRWWEPVHYRERSVKAEIVELHKRILELIPELEDAKKDRDRAQKEVDNHNPDRGLSKPWLAPPRIRRGDIPDTEDEAKKVLELYKGQGGRVRPHGGTRSAFVPEGMSHLSAQVAEGDNYDHVIAYRKPNQGNQQQQQQHKKKHDNQGGGNQNQKPSQ